MRRVDDISVRVILINVMAHFLHCMQKLCDNTPWMHMHRSIEAKWDVLKYMTYPFPIPCIHSCSFCREQNETGCTGELDGILLPTGYGHRQEIWLSSAQTSSPTWFSAYRVSMAALRQVWPRGQPRQNVIRQRFCKYTIRKTYPLRYTGAQCD